MKKLLTLTAVACALAFVLPASAADEKKKPALTEEQTKLQKEILEKYDTNKDGKLDQEERAKISEDDMKKIKEAKLPGFGKKKKD